MSGMLDMETIARFSTEIAKANFGPDNVVRMESEPTADSQGEEALNLLIVIAPGIAETIDGDAVLGTLSQIIDRLRQASDERFPIIEYATEEELADELQTDLTPFDPQHFFDRAMRLLTRD